MKSESKIKNSIAASKILVSLQDRMARICIAYGEGKCTESQFKKYCKQVNEKQLKTLKKYKII